MRTVLGGHDQEIDGVVVHPPRYRVHCDETGGLGTEAASASSVDCTPSLVALMGVRFPAGRCHGTPMRTAGRSTSASRS